MPAEPAATEVRDPWVRSVCGKLETGSAYRASRTEQSVQFFKRLSTLEEDTFKIYLYALNNLFGENMDLQIGFYKRLIQLPGTDQSLYMERRDRSVSFCEYNLVKILIYKVQCSPHVLSTL